MSILKSPPPGNGACPPLEEDRVSKEAAELGLPDLPVMGQTIIGPYSVMKYCEEQANHYWGECYAAYTGLKLEQIESQALHYAVKAFLASKGLSGVWLPSRASQVALRERLVRALHDASLRLGKDKVRRLGFEYSQRVLYLEDPIPETLEQFLRGVLGEHAEEYFPLESFPDRERGVLEALRSAKPGEFVHFTTTGETAAVRRLQKNHRIRIESWKEAKAAGKRVPPSPGKGTCYRLIR